jgi:hypothetical protein
MFLKLLQKAITLGLVLEPNCHATFIVRRTRGRRAKFAATQSAQPRQRRPAQLPHHVADFALGRNK